MASTLIESVFCRELAREARKLEAQGRIEIIPVSEFPEGAPLHEDGSGVYDPRKALALFAVYCRSNDEIFGWWRAVYQVQKVREGVR